jgi:hypothetical protein
VRRLAPLLLAALPLLVAASFSAVPACNSGTASCPAKETITAGGSCDDEKLQCAFDLATPAPACDGTSTTVPSSCICTSKKWVCPDPVECGDAAPPADDAAATDDGAADTAPPDDAGTDAPAE